MSFEAIVDAITYFGSLEKFDIITIEQQIGHVRVENETVQLGGNQSDYQCRALGKRVCSLADRRLMGRTKCFASMDHVLIGYRSKNVPRLRLAKIDDEAKYAVDSWH